MLTPNWSLGAPSASRHPEIPRLLAHGRDLVNGGAGGPSVRFRDAVPVRRDRRDLRRRFRRAARAVMGERKAEMTEVLRRLSADHVPLSGVIPVARGTGTVAVFIDGTRLLLGIRCDGGMERLGQAASRFPVWLADVQPCFGRHLFWLGFAFANHAGPVAVLASVAPVPPGSPESCPG